MRHELFKQTFYHGFFFSSIHTLVLLGELIGFEILSWSVSATAWLRCPYLYTILIYLNYFNEFQLKKINSCFNWLQNKSKEEKKKFLNKAGRTFERHYPFSHLLKNSILFSIEADSLAHQPLISTNPTSITYLILPHCTTHPHTRGNIQGSINFTHLWNVDDTGAL